MDWLFVRTFAAAAIGSTILYGGPASASSNCSAIPGNIVKNCGFETGDLTDWIVVPISDYAYWVSSGSGYDGGYALEFDGVGSTYPLSQILNTSVGTTYSISYMVYGDAVYTDEVSLSWAGLEISDKVDIPAGWQQYTFTETALTTSTELSLGLRDDNSADFLDNITVTAIAMPEPSSLAALMSGLFGFRLIRSRTRLEPLLRPS